MLPTFQNLWRPKYTNWQWCKRTGHKLWQSRGTLQKANILKYVKMQLAFPPCFPLLPNWIVFFLFSKTYELLDTKKCKSVITCTFSQRSHYLLTSCLRNTHFNNNIYGLNWWKMSGAYLRYVSTKGGFFWSSSRINSLAFFQFPSGR